MNLPSFDVFVRSLGPDPADSLIAEALRPDGSEAFASPAEIIGVCYSVNLALLKRYHEWLSRQMSASDG